MNWNKCYRIVIQLILLIILFSVTFIQLLKYQKEITNISISYNEIDLQLPSITMCPKYEEENDKQENITFEEYMKSVLNNNISDLFPNASQYDYMPGNG